MKQRPNNRKADSLLALLLFGVFAVCILAVLLTGADAYRRLSQRDRESYDSRTAVQYLSTRVRQADRLGGVEAGSFEGCPALILPEEIDGVRYETRVYCYDGYLRELFAAADGGFLPSDGEKVLPAEALRVSAGEAALYLELCTADGQWQELTLYLRSGEGAAE